MVPVMGYWDIRGFAEPVRYFLHYVGEEFEDKRYYFGEGQGLLRGDWGQDKYSLGLVLPNLPYYIDDRVKITQSTAILRYLARKHGTYFPEGGTHEVLKLEMLEGHARDIFHSLAFLVLDADYEKHLQSLKPRMKLKLEQLSRLLGENDWSMGDKICHVDFQLFDVIDIWKMLCPDILDGLENLQRYQKRFANLPKIKEYRKTSQKWPLFAPIVYWGGKGEAPQTEEY